MNAIEQSLRRVLAKGDASDPDHRVRIYEASERAIERLLDEGKIDAAGRDAQHAKLIAAIEAIEAEYPPDVPAGAEATSSETVPSAAAAAEPAAPRSRATPLPAGQGPGAASDPAAAAPAEATAKAGATRAAAERRAPATGSARRRRRRAPRRRPSAMLGRPVLSTDSFSPP